MPCLSCMCVCAVQVWRGRGLNFGLAVLSYAVPDATTGKCVFLYLVCVKGVDLQRISCCCVCRALKLWTFESSGILLLRR